MEAFPQITREIFWRFLSKALLILAIYGGKPTAGSHLPAAERPEPRRSHIRPPALPQESARWLFWGFPRLKIFHRNKNFRKQREKHDFPDFPEQKPCFFLNVFLFFSPFIFPWSVFLYEMLKLFLQASSLLRNSRSLYPDLLRKCCINHTTNIHIPINQVSLNAWFTNSGPNRKRSISWNATHTLKIKL